METVQKIGSRNLSSEYEVSYSYDLRSLSDLAPPEPTLDPPCRSTTFYDYDQSRVFYYGHRYYSPSLGRFINRDPIEEQGGINLYSFVGNNSINAWDYLGLDAFGAIEWMGDEETGGCMFVEMDGYDHLTMQGQMDASIERMKPSWSSYAEGALAGALQARNQAALAIVAEAINNGELSKDGKYSGDNASTVSSAFSWVIGDMNAGGNFISNTVSSKLAAVDAVIAQQQAMVARIENSLAVATISSGEVTLLPTLYVDASVSDLSDEIAYTAYEAFSGTDVYVPYSADRLLDREVNNVNGEREMLGKIYPLSSTKKYPIKVTHGSSAGLGLGSMLIRDRITSYEIRGIGGIKVKGNKQGGVSRVGSRWYPSAVNGSPKITPLLGLGGLYRNQRVVPNDWVVVDSASKTIAYPNGEKTIDVNVYGPASL